MPIVNRIAALTDEMAAWRHDFHEHPELLYEVHRTAGERPSLTSGGALVDDGSISQVIGCGCHPPKTKEIAR